MSTGAAAIAAEESPWPSPAAVFERLKGTWRITRHVTPGGILQGSCHFAPGPTGVLRAEERGEFVLDNGTRLRSSRNLTYRAEPSGFSVWFSEVPPRLFHAVRLLLTAEGLAGTAWHLCGKDLYESAYVFAADGTIRVRHAATGPRKSYVSVTDFARCDVRLPLFT